MIFLFFLGNIWPDDNMIGNDNLFPGDNFFPDNNNWPWGDTTTTNNPWWWTPTQWGSTTRTTPWPTTTSVGGGGGQQQIGMSINIIRYCFAKAVHSLTKLRSVNSLSIRSSIHLLVSGLTAQINCRLLHVSHLLHILSIMFLDHMHCCPLMTVHLLRKNNF